MDRITAQISELSDYERFQLLLRLAGDVANSTFQANLSAVRTRRAAHRDALRPESFTGVRRAEPAL